MGSNRIPGEPGHTDPDARIPGAEFPGEELDEGELADVDLGYRGRGRPRLDPSLRRKEKLIISLTVDELRRVMLAGANDRPTPLSPHDWARRELLRLAADPLPSIDGEP